MSKENTKNTHGFKFSDHYNEKNMQLSENEAERLLIEHIKEHDPQTYAQYLAILKDKQK